MTDLIHIVKGPISLSESELASLMKISDGRVVAASFGPAGVWLDCIKSEWAIGALVQMRGLNPDATGGLLIWGASEA